MCSLSHKSSLRFLCVAPDKFPPQRVDVSILFGEQISGRGHRIDFLLQSKDECKKPYQTKWNTIRVYVGATDLGTTFFHRARKRILDFLNNIKILPLILRERYDFIQVKDRYISATLALLITKLFKIKYFYWLSYPFAEANLINVREGTARYPIIHFLRGHLYKYLLYRIILPNADHIFVQSEQMKNDIMVEGIPALKITPVLMGVSLDSIPYNSPRIESEKNHQLEKSVVYLGTLVRIRKIDFLIKVFVKVLQKVEDARLYMVGGGEDPKDIADLQKLALDLKIDKQITFTGLLTTPDAWDYVKKAAVCVSPYYPTKILNSTSPTKLIEYMAFGKAVVANDHPEQKQVITESGAGLCVPYEIDAFADAIIEMLQNPEKAKIMGLKGREYVELYRSYDKIADMLERKYYFLCNKA